MTTDPVTATRAGGIAPVTASRAGGMAAVTAALGGRLAYGGDYNPEQWPESVWGEDVALMREAGVTLVTVGVFGWALVQPGPDRYEFGWLDRVLDLLHDNGIAVDLATGTASPPPWFHRAHPDAALVDADGVRRNYGARQAFCPSSPAYRSAATALAGALAERYADHPAVVLWHVHNEYGCHNWHCFCDASAAAFRRWLQARYGNLEELNRAWGTAFWSQHYYDWAEVLPPRTVAYSTFPNPTQQLDWWRFSSDELVACYSAEAQVLAERAAQPVTTNLMSFFKPIDYWDLSRRMDLVSNDHYLIAADRDGAQQLAMSADLMRSLALGRPWLLMEHSTSAVNWQPRNRAKAPGEMRRNSLSHLARGADGTLFFQWRASVAGAEKFHSAMVPHAGTGSRRWREVVQLGADLHRLAEVAGTRVQPAPVAVLHDWSSWWAAELDSHPSVDVGVMAESRAWHAALWRAGVGTDFAHPAADLAGYRVVIAPVLYLLAEETAARLRRFVESGGTLLVTYFSGIADVEDHVVAGGYPGLLRDLLGVRIEEFYPLLAGERVTLSAHGPGEVWSEYGTAEGAEVIATYAGGPVDGAPAITCHRVGAGAAWYVGTRLTDAGRAEVLRAVLESAGVRPVVDDLPPGMEAVRRVGDGASYLFLINHADREARVAARGTDLLSGADADGTAVVEAGGVAVIRESR